MLWLGNFIFFQYLQTPRFSGMWHWTSYLTSLCLRFLICKVGIIIVSVVSLLWWLNRYIVNMYTVIDDCLVHGRYVNVHCHCSGISHIYLYAWKTIIYSLFKTTCWGSLYIVKFTCSGAIMFCCKFTDLCDHHHNLILFIQLMDTWIDPTLSFLLQFF